MEANATSGSSETSNGLLAATKGGGGGGSSRNSSGGPIRLSTVQGYETRTNDIIYCPPLERVYVKDGKELQNHAIVYFGGDIQDFPENMQVHHDSKAYIKYNLENTALMLRKNFPTSHIVVIKAVRMEFKTFSCYDNFVRGCNAGIPDHTPMNYALQHLEKLLQNVAPRVKAIPDDELIAAMTRPTRTGPEEETTDSSSSGPAAAASKGSGGGNSSNNHQPESNQDVDIDVVQDSTDTGASTSSSSSTSDATTAQTNKNASDGDSGTKKSSATAKHPEEINAQELLWWRDTLNIDKADLTLIAFSKGSVVLNQLIYEFHYIKTLTPDDCSMMRLVSRIRAMYWLDGGHSAPKNTWITSRSLLETLERLNVSIHVHVTPYQVLDDRRPWIRRDEKAFTDLLKRLGANLTRVLHFDSGTTNLFTHFEVLEVFRQYELQTVAAEQALEEAKAAAAAAAAESGVCGTGAEEEGDEKNVDAPLNSSSNTVHGAAGEGDDERQSSLSKGSTGGAAVAMETGGDSETEPMSDDCSN